MASPKLTRKTVLGIKTETTQGTPIALTATDYMYVSDLSVKPSTEKLTRNFYRSTLSPVTTVMGKRSLDVSFKSEVKGGGTAGTVFAPLSACLQACGLAETVSAAVSVTYAPTSAPVSANYFGPGKSATISAYYDGVYYSIAGAMGTCKISLEASKFGVYEFSFKGVYAEPTDAAFPTQTYAATLAPIVQSSALSVQSLSAIASKVEFDFGNDISERIDISSAFGLQGFFLSNRRMAGSFDPEYTTVAAHNFLLKLMTNVEGALSVVVGATPGNITTITAPKLQYSDATLGDRNGVRTLEVPFLLNGSSGDDEISIALT